MGSGRYLYTYRIRPTVESRERSLKEASLISTSSYEFFSMDRSLGLVRNIVRVLDGVEEISKIYIKRALRNCVTLIYYNRNSIEPRGRINGAQPHHR